MFVGLNVTVSHDSKDVKPGNQECEQCESSQYTGEGDEALAGDFAGRKGVRLVKNFPQVEYDD